MKPTEPPTCDVCDRPMILGQHRRHNTCQEPGICTCRDDFDHYRSWVELNVVPLLGVSVIPKPCVLHGAPT